jgi:hypothetical protein
MFRKLVPTLLTAAVVSLPLAAGIGSPAFAESAQAEPVRVRGAIVDFTGQALRVKTREDQTVNIALAPKWMVSSVARADVTDIKPGDYVGIASLPTDDGTDGALEVLIFPAALKGTAEGSFG